MSDHTHDSSVHGSFRDHHEDERLTSKYKKKKKEIE